MQNLNDYYYFVQVVKFQGFTKASEALGITKSKLSRRITDLEARLNVRLIQRSTRKFTVTELGEQFYQHCLKILSQVDETENFIQSTLNDELCGNIKISCPVALVQMPVAQMIARFLQSYPQVNIQLIATNERVDVIEQGIDLAIRVRSLPLTDSDLIVRDLDAWQHVLVASHDFIQQRKSIESFDDLKALPSIGFHRPKHVWEFQHDRTGAKQQMTYQPRLKTDSFAAMKEAMLQGVGVVSLPKVFVREELARGEIIELLPEWSLPQGVIHVAYASRQGMLPAVRSLLDFLIAQFQQLNIDQDEQQIE